MKKTNFIFTFLFAILLVSTNLLSSSVEAAKTPINNISLDFYLVNDFRGQLRHTAKYPGAATVSTAIFNLGENNPGGTIILGGGNMIQGTLDSSLHDGIPTVLALNEFNLSACVLGNHEFDYSKTILAKQQKAAHFPFISANILDNKGNLVFKPYTIIQRKGLKIAIIGLTTKETKEIAPERNIKDFKILDPSKIVNKYVSEVRTNGADIVVLLTHIGANKTNDSIQGEILQTLKKAKGIDAVFTAHTENNLASTYNNIPVIQAGSRGQTIGRVHLVYSSKDKKVIGSSTKLYPIRYGMVPENMKVSNMLTSVFKETNEAYKLVLATNKGPELTNNLAGQSSLGELLADYMKKASKADIVILNGGGICTNIPTGPITLKIYKEMFPYQANLITMDLKGSDLIKAIENGFNYPSIAIGRFSGLNVVADMKKPLGNRLVKATTLENKAIDPNKIYKVAVSSFIANGSDFYTSLSNGTNRKDLGNLNGMFKFLFRSYENINYTSDHRLILLNNN